MKTELNENLVKGKQVKMELVGLDGNAFILMAHFSKNAKHQKWTKKEIKLVIDECQSGDYDHLLMTLIIHTNSSPSSD